MQVDLILWATDPEIGVFLAAQAGIGEVRVQIPKDNAEYLAVTQRLGDPDDTDVLARWGEDVEPGEVWRSHLPFGALETAVPRLPADLVLPATTRRRQLPADGARRLLVMPYSTASVKLAGHWPNWISALYWVLANTNFELVICGRGWSLPAELTDNPRVLNLVGQTETMGEVYALAEQCEGVLATSSNLSVWAATVGKPALVACNERVKDGSFFHRLLRCETSRLLLRTDGVERFAQFFAGLFPRHPVVGRRVWAAGEFDHQPIRLCVPPGIGDLSWVYSKIKHLRAETGREVLLYSPAEQPRRACDLIDLLPNVKWGGFCGDRTGWMTVAQSLPSEWPEHMAHSPFLQPAVQNLSANLWLEMGRPLKDWLPLLPTDYHYPVQIPEPDIETANLILQSSREPIIGVYTSGRNKEKYREEGWALWTAEQWEPFLAEVSRLLGGCSFVMIGASYDEDKTVDVAERLRGRGFHVAEVVARRLGVALEAIRRCSFLFSYPSGIGVMANVLRTPGMMLLPRHLAGLTDSWADPEDLAAGRFRCFPAGEPEEVFAWFETEGVKHVQTEGGVDRPVRDQRPARSKSAVASGNLYGGDARSGQVLGRARMLPAALSATASGR